MNRLFQLASRFLSFGWFSSYESANYSPHRSRVPGAAPTDAKHELTPGIRTELVRRSRYLQKNSGFVREPKTFVDSGLPDPKEQIGAMDPGGRP